MALKNIVIYPDEVLKKNCEPVTDFNDQLKVLAEDMAETMYAAPGVGLAANQVGISKRIFIIDIAEDNQSDLNVFINPEIIDIEGDLVWEEGCLSFPGMYIDVERAAKVTVKAQNTDGEFFELTAEGLFAVAIQHELDHLNGKSLADKVGYLKKKMMIKELTKIKNSKK
ncbi:MAG: peptide deformylase [Deltaproteobacteria bacterium]|nr:peptide deformylase [Deltaproteobacteria bacterium]